MPDIIEKIDDAVQVETIREKRVFLNKIKIDILYQREEFKKTDAELLRLRQGLRDLRHGIFKDSDAVNGLIDELLKEKRQDA